MKICFYCDSIFTFGGVQRVLAVIATQLSYKHDVTILTIDPESSENKSMYDMDKGFVSFRSCLILERQQSGMDIVLFQVDTDINLLKKSTKENMR